jgi:NCS1 family nucleobase:cation symporter-1
VAGRDRDVHDRHRHAGREHRRQRGLARQRLRHGWLIGYSGALGSIAGVLVVDYWVIRKQTLALRDLYVPDGVYRYSGGWNPAAVIATLAGAAVALLGAFWEPMRVIYDWAWFIGFGLAGAIYHALMRARR